jgi:hypothetical protein
MRAPPASERGRRGNGGEHMSDPDQDFRVETTLRDGTAVTIRVMRPDDRQRLIAAFAKLDPSTIYTRFFSYRKEIPEPALERIGEIDFVELAGLVATIGAGDDETVIGGASYVGDRGGLPGPGPRDQALRRAGCDRAPTRHRALHRRCPLRQRRDAQGVRASRAAVAAAARKRSPPHRVGARTAAILKHAAGPTIDVGQARVITSTHTEPGHDPCRGLLPESLPRTKDLS